MVWGGRVVVKLSTTVCRRALIVLASISLFMPLGCGSGRTQDDMRKYARRSAQKSDDAESQPVAEKAKQPATSDVATQPANTQVTPAPSGAVVQPAAAPSAKNTGAVPSETVAATGQTPPASVPSAPLPPAPVLTGPTQPAQPLTLPERRQRTIDNLTAIAAALKKYSDKNGRLFFPATYDPASRPLLSWRVELLPYLGYQQLYDQFHLNEPWDSPHNQTLLAAIPAEYQSPERFDTKTNYVIPVAAFTPFHRREGFGMQCFEDGASETVVVLEVDDVAAVNWTEPAELQLDLNRFTSVVGKLREDGFFVIWGDGQMTGVSRDCSAAGLRAIFTYDGGESFVAESVRVKPVATVESPTEVAATGGAEPAAPMPADTPTDKQVSLAGQAEQDGTQLTPAQVVKYPVPDTRSLEQARKLVREIYHDDYTGKKTLAERKDLARRMIEKATDVSEDVAGHYVLLDIAKDISCQTGDVLTAVDAVEQLVNRFEVDEVELWHDVLAKLGKKERSESESKALLDKARDLVDRALEAEDFERAEMFCQVAMGAGRQLQDREQIQHLDVQQSRIVAARKAYQRIQQLMSSLGNGEDPRASREVGEYYCLVKNEWEKGLPLLGNGNDEVLKGLAEQELKNPTIAADQLTLADGWWAYGEKNTEHQKNCRLRAALWYTRALVELPAGLWRAKAEMRLNEIKRTYGAAALPSEVKTASR